MSSLGKNFSAWRGVGREYLTRFFGAATARHFCQQHCRMPVWCLSFCQTKPTPDASLRRREARERVAVERFVLPGRLVPRPVLISDYLHRHDEAVAAEFVGG